MFSRIAHSTLSPLRTTLVRFNGTNTQPTTSIFGRHKDKVPIYGAIVGTCALLFQILALYPWHEELSHQFIQVEDRDLSSLPQLKTIQKEVAKAKQLAVEHQTMMERVLELEQQVKEKERKILDREDQILAIETTVLAKVEMLLNESRKSAMQEMVHTSVQAALANHKGDSDKH